MRSVLLSLLLILVACQITNVFSDPVVDMLAQYTKKHHQWLAREKSPFEDTLGSPRYLIWRPFPGVGIGNQIIGFVSTLALAMLTDRALLIQDHQRLFHFFEPPLAGTIQLAPKSIPIDAIVDEAMRIRFSKEMEEEAHLAASFRMTHESKDEDFQAILCFDPIKDWKGVKYVVVETCQYFVPLLFANGHTRQQMETMFPDKKVFHHLVGVLFRPIPRLMDKIKGLHQESKSMASDKRIIGLQLRTFDALSVDSMDESAQRCLEENLPQFREQKSSYSPCLFMATLNPAHGDWFRNHNPRAQIVSLPNEGGQTYTEQQHESAIVDIWILAMADELLVSPYSTFGYVAAGLRSKPSYLIVHSGCLKQQGGEPCFHHSIKSLPANFCPAGTTSEIAWTDYMGQCPDFELGMKLNPAK